MSTAELELYEAIKPKLGEKEAQMLLRFMETKVGGEVEKGTSILATKSGVADLKSEMKSDVANLKSEMKSDMADLKSEMKSDVANLKSEMKSDMANLKSEMIKWMFIFWIGTVGTLIGSFIGIFKMAGIL